MLLSGLVVHPLIRLLSFIIFAAFVSLGHMSSSILGVSLLTVVYILSRQLPAPTAWIMIKRLRVFFISIFIMYLWFTPGQLIFPSLVNWSPTFDGLSLGLQRISALIILVLGVECLLRLTDRRALLCGLYYIAYPFKWLGVDRNRFIIRTLLTLEAVEPLKFSENKIKFKFSDVKKYISLVSEHMVNKFYFAVDYSENIQHVEFELDKLPHLTQWLIPICILAIFVITAGTQ